MRTKSGFFIFAHRFTSSDGIQRRYVFAYKAPGALPRQSLDDLILTMCKGPDIPDAVVLIDIAEDKSTNLLELIKAANSSATRQRLASRIPLVHTELSLVTGKSKASLLDSHFKSILAELKRVIEKELRYWIKAGLNEAFDPDSVVLRAPAGYTYQKPSGAKSSLFLKPDMAFSTSSIVSFVALSIFLKSFPRKTRESSDINTIFVDTMAISPVAYELRKLLLLCDMSSSVSIESFHSYSGLEDIPRPMRGTSFCIISASTSMDLHAKWIATKQVPPEEVVTLVTLSSALNKIGALHVIDEPDFKTSAGPAQLSIRMRGETFLPEQEPPKKVLLNEPQHRSEEDVTHFHLLTGRHVFDIYRRPSPSTPPRPLYIDGKELIAQPEFIEWMDERLRLQVKAATRCIVFQDDEASELLAKRVRDYCSQRLNLEELSVVSAAELSSATLHEDSGVIVCAAVVGKGSRLLEISRGLRDKHKGPRLYIVGFQVAEARSELNTLELNLRHSKPVNHEFSRFGKVAIGTQLGQSFKSEVESYYNVSDDLSKLPAQLRKRADLLGSHQKIGQLALLPHGPMAKDVMHLRLGFAFWPDSYASQPCHPEVIATVAALLQRAREHDKLPENGRLATASFRHVVLDPENFSRYNDGVIQAALLRCGYPSELDYRGDYASSDFMKSLVLRCLDRATTEAGESILEFLLAINQRRLQLVDSHREEVISTALSRYSSDRRNRGIHQAISFIIQDSRKTKSLVKSKLPF